MGRKIAVMQPYVFPYLGYFQLINSVDIFVLYDDVNFIKQGWINRNKILLNGKESLFTVPINGVSSFRPIRETEISGPIYLKWQKKFLKSLRQSYIKAPFFENIYPIIETVILRNHKNIGELAGDSIQLVSNYLGIDTEFLYSSECFSDSKSLDKADRLIAIVNELSGDHYINPSGGKELYQKGMFEKAGLKLSFIKNHLRPYTQLGEEFKAGLSIIDVLMFNDIEEIQKMLTQFELE
ncbi:WbqC family protein [Fulvivirga ulvae]|uniref:WbqC family protein n=1 Tax=Fulvivirga ulvae TaxID=2904245 RepID=UPI001F4083FB|nr:WbqC family protein [Fulvivirga ulvae]UII31663.1 WbqC family protein [Fulvivirga ulvae]